MEYIFILLIIISLPSLFGAIKESGRIKAPRLGRRKFPTFPVQGEEE